jgi:hypothetical protein
VHAARQVRLGEILGPYSGEIVIKGTGDACFRHDTDVCELIAPGAAGDEEWNQSLSWLLTASISLGGI